MLPIVSTYLKKFKVNGIPNWSCWYFCIEFSSYFHLLSGKFLPIIIYIYLAQKQLKIFWLAQKMIFHIIFGTLKKCAVRSYALSSPPAAGEINSAPIYIQKRCQLCCCFNCLTLAEAKQKNICVCINAYNSICTYSKLNKWAVGTCLQQYLPTC